MKKLKFGLFIFIVVAVLSWGVSPAVAAKKPNILIIMGDDIGIPIYVYGPEMHMTSIIPMALSENGKGVN